MRHTAGAYVIGPYLLVHQRLYRLTGGVIGRHVAGRPALLLHTVGRRTGKPRSTALTYAKDGDDYLVVASYGGAPRHPAWFLNLRDDPRVEVQVGRHRQPAQARVAQGEERDRLWKLVNQQNRGLAPLLHRGALGRYDIYQRHTSRELPVVVLTPEAAGTEPAADV
ncbi:MAG: nitroreductase family deazaflavin-dependent oxidoreductase [Acidimicrobiales bacterium]